LRGCRQWTLSAKKKKGILMTVFGVVALLGLAVLVAGKVAYRYLSFAPEFWAAAFVVLGVGATWLADFDLFAAWSLPIRAHAVGLVLTGFMVAGAALFWREVLGFFGGLARKLTDEAQSLEKSQGLRSVA
jgi:hypothetical protein